MRMPANQAKFAEARTPSLLLSIVKELANKLGVVEGDEDEEEDEEYGEGKERKGAVGAVVRVGVREAGGGGHDLVQKEMFLRLTIAAISALATHEGCREQMEDQGDAIRGALTRVAGKRVFGVEGPGLESMGCEGAGLESMGCKGAGLVCNRHQFR